MSTRQLPTPTTSQPAPTGAAAGVAPAPVVVNKDLTTWRGVLTLTNDDARLLSNNKTYSLFIKASGQSSKILKDGGYKTGDQINVIGKITGDFIEVAGVNK
jgi:hypothetical protein